MNRYNNVEKKNYIVAVDLGTSSVVVAVGTKSPDGRINVEDIVVKPCKGVERGEVKNSEFAAKAIREALNEAEEHLGIRITDVYTGISGSHVRYANHPYHVYVSGQDGEVMEDDVRRLNENMQNMQAPDGYRLLNIIPQHYKVDNEDEVHYPVGMFGKTLGSTFGLIVGETTNISRLEKAFTKTDVKVAEIFVNPLATAEAVTFPDEKDLGVAVIDIGAGITDLCIYQDGIVRYVGVIPIGADSINKDIRSYGIMERHVEELKVKYGCAMSSQVDSEKLVKVPGRTPSDHKEISFQNLASIIEARMLDIIDFVLKEIKDAGYENKLNAGIILTGGSAQLKEIKKLFEAHTGMDVRIAVPDIHITDESKELADDTRLSTAIGLLYKGSHKGGSNVEVLGRNATQQPVRPPVAEPEEDGQEEYDPFTDDDDIRGRKPAKTGKKKKDGKKTEPKQAEKEDKRSFLDKLKGKFEKAFDFDVLDDDNEV